MSIYHYDQNAVYCIRAKGSLSDNWADYFDGLTISQQKGADGQWMTILVGKHPDQAALQGTLQKLYILGLCLESVEKIEPNS